MTAPLDQIIADLRAGLEGVTPGPWKSAGGYLTVRDPDKGSFTHTIYHLDEMGQRDRTAPFQAVPLSREQDAAHIARCSPDNIAAILNALSEATSRVETLEAVIEQLHGPLNIAALTARAERAEAERDAAVGDWRTDNPPQDGTPIYRRVIQPYRFLPYKPNSSQAKRGEKGRWQMMNEYGGWENCPWPLGNEWSLTHPSERSARSQETTP